MKQNNKTKEKKEERLKGWELNTFLFDIGVKELPEEFGFLKDHLSLTGVTIFRLWNRWHLFIKIKRL